MTAIQVHERAVGDTLTPYGFKLRYADGKPVDLTGKTPKVVGKKDDGTAWIAETPATGHPTTTCTGATDGYITANDHLVENGDQVVFSTTGTLPAGLTAGQRYFARDVEANRFKVATSPDAQPVTITDAGTGTHSYYVVGSGQYDFQSADVASSGTFWLWVRVYSGSEYDTYPIVRNRNDRGMRIDLLAIG